MAKYLLEQGADPTIGSNPGNHTALHYAAWRGEADCTLVRYLIQYGADVNAPADMGCFSSTGETGESLHEWFFDPGPDELELVYPIHCAASSSVSSMVEALLEAGADIQARTSTYGSTPLHLAAGSGLCRAALEERHISTNKIRIRIRHRARSDLEARLLLIPPADQPRWQYV